MRPDQPHPGEPVAPAMSHFYDLADLASPTMTQMTDQIDSSLQQRITALIDLMRPSIQADGGDVEFVEVTKKMVVRVRFHGACVGCPSSTMTLQGGIARRLQERIPEITAVEAVE